MSVGFFEIVFACNARTSHEDLMKCIYKWGEGEYQK